MSKRKNKIAAKKRLQAGNTKPRRNKPRKKRTRKPTRTQVQVDSDTEMKLDGYSIAGVDGIFDFRKRRRY